ncbi:menaquinone-dependent protoporphyrinogen IX dehydrogenase [Methylomonas sp. MO1]|uniref:menaquinone-dependent protoporphyrinogen IX dehydrogenase n=1 Tax=unclassified Methylomonas TaxID=2608980 RepID=UPI00047C1A8B|nr:MULTISPECIES: menaquinone-dependent protoporphyrinogen IX dehydrogenase [unclassified Methylomonas]MDT4290554.1 menaquinone-dependent protoporphyrinogen IX dehydrogenase [Methylomonas sp. MO1]
MPKILIIYSTRDGQTLKICQRLQSVIEQQSHQVTLVPIQEVDRVALQSFDKIVMGASIHYGNHGPQVLAFINQNQTILDSKPNAFFSVNVVARKPEKQAPNTNPYLKKFLKRIPWKPKQLAAFAGKIDYPSYSSFDRSLIRLIMMMTRGPTDPTAVVEFTDWDQVDAFGLAISSMEISDP